MFGVWLPLVAIGLIAACSGTGSTNTTARTLRSISLTPTSMSVAAGVTEQLAATAVYSDGSKQDVSSNVTWKSSNIQVATINASGLASSLTAGATIITATLSGISGSATLTVTAATLVSIGLTPAMPSLAAGSTQQFTAMGVYTDNSKHDLTTSVTWKSSNASVASISNSTGSRGLATTLVSGSTSVAAALNAITSQAVTLTVSPAKLVSIAVTPGSPSIAAGTIQQFKATGTYTDHSTQDLTAEATWSSSNNSVASFSNSVASTGLATSQTPGSTSVTAAVNGTLSPAVTLIVTQATLVSIDITPVSQSIAAGTHQQFMATGTYTDHSTQNLTTAVTWSSSNTSLASISNANGSNGLATGLQTGQISISAQIGSLTSTPVTLTVTSATLVSIAVTPAAASIAAGTTEQFTATGTYTDHSTQVLTASVTWSSSNESVASISNASASDGLATALETGQVRVSAQIGSVTSTPVMLAVTPATLVSIAVTPTSPSIAAGTTQQFTATGTFSDNSTQNITASANWISSNTSVVSISNASGSNGLATSLQSGQVNIIAQISNVVSSPATLNVTQATLVSIGVTPAMPSLAAGSTQQFSATGVYTDNSTHDLTASATWSSANTAVASISNAAGSNGLATTLAPGSTLVTASLYGITSPAAIMTVTPATLVSIAVTPAIPSIAAGTSQQFTATGTYTDNSTQILTTTATWSSSNAAVVSISNASGSNGLATGLQIGQVNITAQIGSITSTPVTLTVAQATLVSIAVTPTTSSIAAGTTQRFTATGTYTDQSTQDFTASATWISSNVSVASISNASGSSGLATGLETGQVSVTAQVGSVTSTPAALTVTQATLVSIAVTPVTPSATIGDNVQFTATGTYTDTTTQNLTTAATWTSSNPLVATISNASGSNGQATSLTAGSTQITASSGTVAAPAVSLQVVVPTETVLHYFSGSPDGLIPQFGAMIQGSDGNFYGTTVGGGFYGYGTVFKVTATGSESVLYSFSGYGVGSNGYNPFSVGLVQDSDGNLYGTTSNGGAAGYGTVFKLTPTGVETDLHSFAGGNDGAVSYASLILGIDGNFYGTTTSGGVAGYGTVFRMTPAGAESVLYSFAGGSDGATPYASLIQGVDGNFYGTTTGGGAAGHGTVFKLTPSGVEAVLYSFAGGSDGATPYASLIQGVDGNFYGTTLNGGTNSHGTVFKVTPGGTETVLHSFSGGTDGAAPYAELTQGSDGNFYGTTCNGGTDGYNLGTIFRVTPQGTETVLYSFFENGNDGACPVGGLVQGGDGNFYGTTQGIGNNFSTVFKY